jgi:hypothetical protein
MPGAYATGQGVVPFVLQAAAPEHCSHNLLRTTECAAKFT